MSNYTAKNLIELSVWKRKEIKHSNSQQKGKVTVRGITTKSQVCTIYTVGSQFV